MKNEWYLLRGGGTWQNDVDKLIITYSYFGKTYNYGGDEYPTLKAAKQAAQKNYELLNVSGEKE